MSKKPARKTRAPRPDKRRQLAEHEAARAAPPPRKPRKSVVTLVVTHTLETKRELRALFLGEARTRGTSSIHKITVRDVDFD